MLLIFAELCNRVRVVVLAVVVAIRQLLTPPKLLLLH